MVTGREAPSPNASRFIVVRDMSSERMINLRLDIAIIVFRPAAFLVGGYRPTAAEPAQGPDRQDRAGLDPKGAAFNSRREATHARVILIQDIPGPGERTLSTR
jgi:hypothetical protein